MARKHNTKHLSRGKNTRYVEKVREGLAGGTMPDPILSDHRRASAKRS